MRKFIFVLSILVIVTGSACVNQAAQVPPTTGVPTPESTSTSTPTPSPSDTPTSTPPTITSSGGYPQISSSSDLFNQVVSVDPANPQRMAYCSPAEIQVSQDGGDTWEAVPASGAAAAAQAEGYSLFWGEPGAEDACLSVALDPNHLGTYYATFSVAHAEYGAPPVYYMGFFTPDSGETWQLVEPPQPATYEDFGGFWNLAGDHVEALFHTGGFTSLSAQDVLVTETSDGGASWQDGALSCPGSGPCLRWGPAPSNIPGMGSPLPQPVFYSADAGGTWSTIEPPVELRTAGPNQLVVEQDDQLLIISGGISLSQSAVDTAAVRRSLDGGESWQPVQLPPLATDAMNENYYPGLQIVPGQGFLSQSPEQNTWYWYTAEGSSWCPLSSEHLPTFPVLLQKVAGQLWWVDPNSQQAEQVAISELSCVVE